MPYTKKKNEQGQTCVHKQGPDGKPMGESMGCHDTEAEADAQIAALMENEPMMNSVELGKAETWHFYTKLDRVDPYKWFTILPYGKFSRWGRDIEMTVEMAKDMVKNFRIVPPTELGINREHQKQFGKIGNIAALRAGSDGLQARPDWFDTGLQEIKAKAWQYFSAEVIFDTIDFEGGFFKNILVGLAVTNDPYFGSLTSIFTADDPSQQLTTGAGRNGSASDPINEDASSKESHGGLMDEQVVAEGIVTQFMSRLAKAFNVTGNEPATAPAPVATAPTPAPEPTAPKTYGAKLGEQAQIEALKQQVERLRVDKRKAEMLALLGDGEGFGDIAEALAIWPDHAAADYLAQEFSALKNQVAASVLFSEFGTANGDREAVTPAERYEIEVDRKIKDGLDLAEAHKFVAREHPDLYTAFRKASGRPEED